MMTVKKLKELISDCDDDVRVEIDNGWRTFYIDTGKTYKDRVLLSSNSLDEYIDEYSME